MVVSFCLEVWLLSYDQLINFQFVSVLEICFAERK